MKKSNGTMIWGITLVQFTMLLLVGGLVLFTDARADDSKKNPGTIKNPGIWTPQCGTPGGLACLSEEREGAASTVIDHEIIMSHGLTPASGHSNDTRIYDTDADTWSNPAPSTPPACLRSEVGGAAHDDLHYVVGGRGPCKGGADRVLNDLEVYDRDANAWSTLPSMPTPRAGLAAVIVGNKLYAIGGRDAIRPGTGTALNCVEAYDIASSTWGPACGMPGAPAPLPQAAKDVAAVAHGRKIYVIGGDGGVGDSGGGGALLNTVQIYDVANNSWAHGAAMPTPRGNLALAKCGKVIVALGGRTVSSGTSTVVEAYEIRSNVWSGGLSPMPTPKSEHGAVTHGNLVHALGSGIFGMPKNSHEALACSSLFKKKGRHAEKD